MKLLSGSEHFLENGRELPVPITDFWKWGCSDLDSNYIRALMAEYFIYLSAPSPKHIQEMSPRRYLISSGYRIAVESAAYIQSEDPDHPDHISFRIPNTPCDIAVFCVYEGLSPESSPMNLDLWKFYVLSWKSLSVFGERRTLTFQSLISLSSTPCNYTELPNAIQITMNA